MSSNNFPVSGISKLRVGKEWRSSDLVSVQIEGYPDAHKPAESKEFCPLPHKDSALLM